MQTLAVQFLDQGFHRILFDAMPMPVFVVDEDVSILEYNSAAARLISLPKPNGHPPRAGDVLHCINAVKSPTGCGRAPACPDCPVRNSVLAAFRGETVRRQPSSLELLADGKQIEVNLQLSCQPLAYQGKKWALLILEGLNDFVFPPTL